MKTLKIVLFLLALGLGHSQAQVNLVPNPSFEDTLNCIGFKQHNNSFPWFNPNTATPDYYYGYNPSCGVSVYNNPSGYQIPRTGDAFVGLYLWTGNTREYISIQLLDTLEQAKNYHIEFYIVRNNYFSLATDDIGCYLSSTPILLNNPSNLPVIPQIQNIPNNYLIDTLNWLKIEGIYTAIGNELFLTIENFYDTPNTSLIDVDSSPNTYNTSKYYIDDVSVIEIDSITSVEEYLNYSIEITTIPDHQQ